MKTRIGRLARQRGFTLLELLAVMAIIGILAAILVPTVSSTGETGRDTQTKQDATLIESSSGEYFADNQNSAEVVTPETVTITATINSDTTTTTTQKTSSRWPEKFLTVEASATTSAAYLNELPTSASPTDNIVVDVTIKDSDGVAITRTTLSEDYTAIDFSLLEKDGYISLTPDSVTNVSTVNSLDYHSIIWAFRKETSSAGSGTDDARKVVVFKLTAVDIVEGTSTVNLTYEQIS